MIKRQKPQASENRTGKRPGIMWQFCVLVVASLTLIHADSTVLPAFNFHCHSDLTKDHRVDMVDLAHLLTRYATYYDPVAELANLLAQWGNCPGKCMRSGAECHRVESPECPDNMRDERLVCLAAAAATGGTTCAVQCSTVACNSSADCLNAFRNHRQQCRGLPDFTVHSWLCDQQQHCQSIGCDLPPECNDTSDCSSVAVAPSECGRRATVECRIGPIPAAGTRCLHTCPACVSHTECSANPPSVAPCWPLIHWRCEQGQCTPKCGSPSCHVDADCQWIQDRRLSCENGLPSEFVCLRGQCQEYCEHCHSADDCPLSTSAAPTSCEFGMETWQCTDDLQCQPVCNDAPRCSTDAHCANITVEGDRCHSGTPVYICLKHPEDFPQQQQGFCALRCRQCTNSSECGGVDANVDDFHCLGGRNKTTSCISGLCITHCATCERDSQCLTDSPRDGCTETRCIRGKCSYACGVDQCEIDDDCADLPLAYAWAPPNDPPRWVCLDRTCRSVFPPPQICQADSDCASLIQFGDSSWCPSLRSRAVCSEDTGQCQGACDYCATARDCSGAFIWSGCANSAPTCKTSPQGNTCGIECIPVSCGPDATTCFELDDPCQWKLQQIPHWRCEQTTCRPQCSAAVHSGTECQANIDCSSITPHPWPSCPNKTSVVCGESNSCQTVCHECDIDVQCNTTGTAFCPGHSVFQRWVCVDHQCQPDCGICTSDSQCSGVNPPADFSCGSQQPQMRCISKTCQPTCPQLHCNKEEHCPPQGAAGWVSCGWFQETVSYEITPFHWYCNTQTEQCSFQCPFGRPFGDNIVAPLEPTEESSWTHSTIAERSPTVNASRIEEYQRMALFEHASVASFSVFSLQLMSVAAPKDLIEAAHRAALDEVRHAEMAFGLARYFGGESVEPGQFPELTLQLRPNLLDLALSTAKEACVGETLSTLASFQQVSAEPDAHVATVLSQITADEAGHAALGWNTVRWAISEDAAVVGPLKEFFASSGRAPVLYPLLKWLFSEQQERMTAERIMSWMAIQ